MHLNSHTPRAILFAGPRYGGLSIPELYTDQSYGQLSLLVGHLKMADDIGQLILNLLSHLQLQVGSSTPVFSNSYPPYAKWIDSSWLTSIWKFTSQIRLGIDIEHQWIPAPARAKDSMIMDLALTFHLTDQQLKSINVCRMYLQVLALSDITAADGKSILPNILHGICDTQHHSPLNWPNIQRPPPAFWSQWHLFLNFIRQGKTLYQPLGPWTAPPLQKWTWFQHKSGEVYHLHHDDNKWHIYEPQQPVMRRRTRQRKPVFETYVTSPFPPHPEDLYPTTITYLHDTSAFTSTPSTSTLPASLHVSSPSMWPVENTPLPLQDTALFFQKLIGPTPPSDAQCQEISQEILHNALLACSDGAHDATSSKASHGWIFGSSIFETIQATGAGPVDGHPQLLSSFRAELSGILAVLY